MGLLLAKLLAYVVILANVAGVFYIIYQDIKEKRNDNS